MDQEIELKQKSIKIKFGDEYFAVKPMNLMKQIDHQKKMKECGEDVEKQLLVTIDLFKELGVPEKVLDAIDADFALKLVNVLAGLDQKKSE